MVLDGIDKKIIRMLIENSRRPPLKSKVLELEQHHQRLKLEKNFITSSTIKVNTVLLQYISVYWYFRKSYRQ